MLERDGAPGKEWAFPFSAHAALAALARPFAALAVIADLWSRKSTPPVGSPRHAQRSLWYPHRRAWWLPTAATSRQWALSGWTTCRGVSQVHLASARPRGAKSGWGHLQSYKADAASREQPWLVGRSPTCVSRAVWPMQLMRWVSRPSKGLCSRQEASPFWLLVASHTCNPPKVAHDTWSPRSAVLSRSQGVLSASQH